MREFPKVKSELVTWGFDKRVISPEHQAIINPDNGEVYAITSKHYRIVEHEELLDTIVGVIQGEPEYGEHYDTDVWLSDNGAKMHAKFRFPDIEFPVNGNGGDMVNPTVEVFNSYDMSWALKVMFGAFRLVCSNGLVIGKIMMNYRRKHMSEGVSQERIKQILMGSLEKFSFQTDLWKSWVDKVTTFKEYEDVMTALPLSEKDREDIGNEVEVSSDIMMDSIKTNSLSYWLFYNILCQYVTHKVKSEIKRVGIQNSMKRFF